MRGGEGGEVREGGRGEVREGGRRRQDFLPTINPYVASFGMRTSSVAQQLAVSGHAYYNTSEPTHVQDVDHVDRSPYLITDLSIKSSKVMQ